MTKQDTTGDLPSRMRGPEGRKQGSFIDRKWSLAFSLAAALLVSACGGSDEEPASDANSATAVISGPAEAAAASTASADTPPPASGDVAVTPTPASSARAPAEAASAAAPADSAAAPASTPAPAAVAEAAEPPAVNEALLVTNLDEPALSPEMAAMIEAGDAEAGRRYAQRCVGCHSMREEQTTGGPQVGPVLFGIFDAPAGAQADFDYSPALAGMGEAGLTWTAARLNAFLTDPPAALPGTTMSSGAIADDENRANVIAYLKSLQPEPEAPGANADLIARIAGADLADGEALAVGRCGGCHTFTAGGETIVGPNLYDIVGRQVAAVEGFAYSQALRDLGADATWTFDRLDAFLAGPAVAVPGTRMGFAGLSDPDDRAAVIAYLRTLSEAPVSLTGQGLLGIGVYQEDLTPIVFSRGQAEIGQARFGTFGCDACHEPGLLGGVAGMGGAVPPLVGFRFEEKWYGGTVYALFNYLEQHAAQQANDIADTDLPFLMAFILSRNGFQPGTILFPLDRDAMRGMGFYQ